MRHSNRSARTRTRSTLAAGALALGITLAVVACGSSAAPTPAPSVLPTPVITPDPHLREPVTADQIYVVLAAARLGMTCPNATLGDGNPAIVKQINCTVHGWPLRITQYQSGAALNRTLDWVNGQAPKGDEPPYNWSALNIAIEYGPTNPKGPPTPPADQRAVAAQIIGLLDPLLWPMTQHSVVAIPARTPEPTATPSPTPAPSKASTKPGKTPRPSRTP